MSNCDVAEGSLLIFGYLSLDITMEESQVTVFVQRDIILPEIVFFEDERCSLLSEVTLFFCCSQEGTVFMKYSDMYKVIEDCRYIQMT